MASDRGRTWPRRWPSGADAVSIGVAALVALGCNRRAYRGATGEMIDVEADYAALSTSPGHCAHCHTGRCPVGITTQDPTLESRLELGVRR